MEGEEVVVCVALAGSGFTLADVNTSCIEKGLSGLVCAAVSSGFFFPEMFSFLKLLIACLVVIDAQLKPQHWLVGLVLGVIGLIYGKASRSRRPLFFSLFFDRKSWTRMLNP